MHRDGSCGPFQGSLGAGTPSSPPTVLQWISGSYSDRTAHTAEVRWQRGLWAQEWGSCSSWWYPLHRVHENRVPSPLNLPGHWQCAYCDFSEDSESAWARETQASLKKQLSVRVTRPAGTVCSAHTWPLSPRQLLS